MSMAGMSSPRKAHTVKTKPTEHSPVNQCTLVSSNEVSSTTIKSQSAAEIATMKTARKQTERVAGSLRTQQPSAAQSESFKEQDARSNENTSDIQDRKEESPSRAVFGPQIEEHFSHRTSARVCTEDDLFLTETNSPEHFTGEATMRKASTSYQQRTQRTYYK